MKRFALGLTLVFLLVLSPLAVAYYSLPQHFAQPLLDVNRALSGLSEKTVTVGPHQVHYLEGGSGEVPLVLLHGILPRKTIGWTLHAAHRSVPRHCARPARLWRERPPARPGL